MSAAVSASGFSTKQCLPASNTRVASSACVGTGVATTTASRRWVGQQVLDFCGETRARELRLEPLPSLRSAVAAPSELAARDSGEIAGEIRAPVPEPNYADMDGVRLSQAGHSTAKESAATPRLLLERRGDHW